MLGLGLGVEGLGFGVWRGGLLRESLGVRPRGLKV